MTVNCIGCYHRKDVRAIDRYPETPYILYMYVRMYALVRLTRPETCLHSTRHSFVYFYQ